MESMDTVRERIEALAQREEQVHQQTRTVTRRLRWWRTLPWVMLLMSLVSRVPLSRAADFTCTAGDRICLIDAIKQANANGEANTLTLDVGVYTLGVVDNETDGPNGLPSITSPLTITGAGAHSTIIEREGGPESSSAGIFRVVHVAAAGELTLSGVTVRGGLLTTARNPGGAGIFNRGSLTLTHSTIADNTVQAGDVNSAGGLVNTGQLTLRASLITHNIGGGFDGSVSGGLANTGTGLLTHSRVAHNMISRSGSQGPLRDFSGGVLNTGTLTLRASFITDNTVPGVNGIGIGGLTNRGGQVSVTTTTIAANLSAGGDSAIGGFFNDGGTATLTQSTIAANRGSGENGVGGIANSGTLTIVNSTIAGNTGSGPGATTSAELSAGGIGNNGPLTILNSTIAGNTGNGDTRSGGILVGGLGFVPPSSGSVTLQNTLLARNTTPPSPAFRSSGPDCNGPLTSLGNNLIGDLTGCTLTLHPSDLTGAPGVDTFTENGRPGNGHFPLLPTSPAIDAGNDAVCPRRDQLGQRRVPIRGVGTGICDIGAIEFQHRHKRQHDEADDHHEADAAHPDQATP